MHCFPQIQLPEWLHLQGWRRSTGGKIAKLQNGTNIIFFSAFILFCPWRPASRVHGRLPLVLWRRLWTWVLGDTIRGLPQNRKFRCPLKVSFWQRSTGLRRREPISDRCWVAREQFGKCPTWRAQFRGLWQGKKFKMPDHIARISYKNGLDFARDRLRR